MKRAFLFDIDGTLVDTGGCGRRAYTRAFEAVFGVPDAFAGIPFSGRTDPGILRSATELRLGRDPDPEEEARFYGAYLEGLERELASASSYRVYPGVEAVLAGLAARPDCVVGLCTGNLAEGARLKLARGGLDGLFAFGGYGSDDGDRPALTRVALERAREVAGGPVLATVVGDSPLDAHAARANGLRLVLVATGWTPEDELRAERPDAFLSSMEDWDRTTVALLGLPSPLRAGTADLDRAAAAIASGGVIVCPTQTLYGLSADALDPSAADRVRRIKGGRDAPFLVLVPSAEDAFALAAPGAHDGARALAAAFWPGPLTLALPAAPGLPPHLPGPGGTVAVRVDAHPFPGALAAACGRPLLSTSANRSGLPPPSQADALDPAVGAACDLVVTQEAPLAGSPSTLAAVDGDGVRVIRAGAIPEDALLAALARWRQ
ncbi:MAG: threonylcarbamoyl-AMP synthase [Deltaproteobacteria bacterium]|nr:threonylcarbamoyl-AMP synthase [Deltaproteobacteria bacterium]